MPKWILYSFGGRRFIDMNVELAYGYVCAESNNHVTFLEGKIYPLVIIVFVMFGDSGVCVN
jgi:hypothetical protein